MVGFLKRNKYMLMILSVFGIFFNPGLTANAEVGSQRVFDEADLFSEQEISLLEEEVRALQMLMNADVAIVTTEDTSGKSTFDFADVFYYEHQLGFGVNEDGVLFVIDMDNREIDLITEGKMIDLLTDARIDSILDDAFNSIVEGDYVGTARSFLAGVEHYYNEGIVDGQYRYEDQPKPPVTFVELAVMAAISLGVGGAFYGIVLSKYRSSVRKPAFSLRQNSRVNLRTQHDRFINQRISKTRLPKNPPSSGGSSGGSHTTRSTVRTASSGRSRGGGRGRSF